MSAVTATPSTEEVRLWCDRAGMRPDSPLRLALLTATDAAVAARDAAGGARGLTPEGERMLIQHVAEAAACGAERELLRLSRRLAVRTTCAVVLVALVLLTSGYAIGRWQGAGQLEAIRGVSFLAQIAAVNDLSSLRQHCERTAYQQSGRRACMLPPVWVDAGSR